jgi:transposase InsO family protein
MDAKLSYSTMSRNSIKYMLKFVTEFELVRAKQHPQFQYARDFFKARDICFQNFYKFYNRFIASGRDESALLPYKRGPKPKYLTMPTVDESLEKKVLEYRKNGHNKFTIAEALKKDKTLNKSCSPSTIYRICARYGVSRLNKSTKEHKVHLDLHVLPKGLVKEHPLKRFYIFGVIDSFSRISWTEVVESSKALDATFAMFDAILVLHQSYGITIEEVLTDNGSEFCGGQKTMNNHPFERLLSHFKIKHRRTKPYRPQTNGKIERYWRSFDEMVIEGVEFDTVDQLKDAVLGYNFYYNEYRPHQGINGKTPINMLVK